LCGALNTGAPGFQFAVDHHPGSPVSEWFKVSLRFTGLDSAADPELPFPDPRLDGCNFVVDTFVNHPAQSCVREKAPCKNGIATTGLIVTKLSPIPTAAIDPRRVETGPRRIGRLKVAPPAKPAQLSLRTTSAEPSSRDEWARCVFVHNSPRAPKRPPLGNPERWFQRQNRSAPTSGAPSGRPKSPPSRNSERRAS